MAYIIPIIIIAVFAFAVYKKVNIYSTFCEGIEEAFKFTLSTLPTLCAIFMMCELFEASTLSSKLCDLLSPVTTLLGIPKELTKLVLIKPFSGSGSLAYLSELIATYGADNYISRCACVMYGSSETIFYISAVYFSKTKKKNLVIPITCALIGTLISAILACQLCKVL
jgi:spore maturation protein B